MTKSEQIIEAARLEIAAQAVELTDPVDLKTWCYANNIGPASLSAACGAAVVECDAKLRCGVRGRDSNPSEYDRLSLPLTQANYAGRASSWDQDKPITFLNTRLSEALDATRPHPIDVAYRREFGREPDAAGFAFYAGLFDAGDFTVNDMLRDMAKNGDQS